MKIENAKFETKEFKLADIKYNIAICDNESSCWTFSIINAIGPMLREEIKRELPNNKQFYIKFLSYFFENLARIFSIDKVIYPKHYGFSTCLFEELEVLNIIANLDDLKMQYPNHAIILRSIPQNFIYKIKPKFKPIVSRLIWQLDNVKNQWSTRTDVKNDIKIIEEYQLQYRFYDETISDEKLQKCLFLYNELYIEKYSKFNPKYKLEYLKHLLKKQIITIHCLEKNNDIMAFCALYEENGQLTSPMLGYENCDIPLYRAIMTIAPKIAIEKNLKLNLSSGASKFKQNRGALHMLEYYLIIDDHLSLWRRLGYSIFAFVFKNFENELLKTAK